LKVGMLALVGAIAITPEEVLKAPLALGRSWVKVGEDGEGPYLCGSSDRGPGFLAFIPHFEVRNPFGDRHDWVALDISPDGARYEPLAWLSGAVGRKQPRLVYRREHRVKCQGRERIFLRLRIGPWWYRDFPRFRGIEVKALPEGTKVGVDKGWTKEEFFSAFRRGRRPDPGKPAPHVLYLTNPLLGLLLRDLVSEEQVDGCLLFSGWPQRPAGGFAWGRHGTGMR